VDTNNTVTVSQILDRYQAQCLHLLAPRTARDYTRHIGHLKARFGPLNATELKPRDFGPFIQERAGKKGQVQRVRQLAVLSAALTQAVSFWYLLDANVLRDVKRPKRPPRDRLIEDHEFEAVRALAPLRVRLMMDLAVRLGQRQGDLLDLKWSDLREGFVNLQQGKTGKRLAIEITPELKRVFGQCWMLPGGGKDGGPYVITREIGGRYTSEGFRANWQRSINKYCRLGGKRFSFHDLRALCATRCPTPEVCDAPARPHDARNDGARVPERGGAGEGARAQISGVTW
jgi:integrase